MNSRVPCEQHALRLRCIYRLIVGADQLHEFSPRTPPKIVPGTQQTEELHYFSENLRTVRCTHQVYIQRITRPLTCEIEEFARTPINSYLVHVVYDRHSERVYYTSGTCTASSNNLLQKLRRLCYLTKPLSTVCPTPRSIPAPSSPSSPSRRDNKPSSMSPSFQSASDWSEQSRTSTDGAVFSMSRRYARSSFHRFENNDLPKVPQKDVRARRLRCWCYKWRTHATMQGGGDGNRRRRMTQQRRLPTRR